MRRVLGVLAVIAVLHTAARADILSPGTLIPGLTGTTVADEPRLAGNVVEDVTTPFSYTGWFQDSSFGAPPVYGDVTGTVRSRVVHSVDGTYDFYWQITVDRTSFLPIANFNLAGLSPATYNANWRRDSRGTVQPAYVSEQESGDITWAFGQYIAPSTEIYPGQQSHLLFLDTDARYYRRSTFSFFSLGSERDSGGSMMIQWGGASGEYPTFAPSTVPEVGSRRAPPAIAEAAIAGDAFLRTLPGRTRSCIVARIAHQQAQLAAYGPRGGPYDEAAVRAATLSYASACS